MPRNTLSLNVETNKTVLMLLLFPQLSTGKRGSGYKKAAWNQWHLSRDLNKTALLIEHAATSLQLEALKNFKP